MAVNSAIALWNRPINRPTLINLQSQLSRFSRELTHKQMRRGIFTVVNHPKTYLSEHSPE
jgi:hypothetical protein